MAWNNKKKMPKFNDGGFSGSVNKENSKSYIEKNDRSDFGYETKRNRPSYGQNDGSDYGYETNQNRHSYGQNDRSDYGYETNQNRPGYRAGREPYRSNASGGTYRNRSRSASLHSVDRKRFFDQRLNIEATLPDNSSPQVIEHLSKCSSGPSARVTLQEFTSKSLEFWNKFPSENARLHVISKKNAGSTKRLEGHINSVYPIIHHATLRLMIEFLSHKSLHGSHNEKKIYDGMNVIQFVERLLKKRPYSFLGANDRHLLPYELGLEFRVGGFETIGKGNETYPHTIENFLSYDEMRLSALISLSSWSDFINNGERKNEGTLGFPGSFQEVGVICGQVGCRFKKPGHMDNVDILVTSSNNVEQNGYGGRNGRHINSVWSNFWQTNLPLYETAKQQYNDQKHVATNNTSKCEYIQVKDSFFNVTLYKKRIVITAHVLLCEAVARAKERGKKAYVHVVGLGLGVWKSFSLQDQFFVEAWGDAIKHFKLKNSIGFIDFSYIEASSVMGCGNDEKFPDSDITIRFSKRNLHDPVPSDCILVCNYAWDSNCLPGNEFWLEKLSSTGDSAAACSSNIAEIQNHCINPMVRGDCLRVAAPDGRIMHWKPYLTYLKDMFNPEKKAIVAKVEQAKSTDQTQTGKGKSAQKNKNKSKNKPTKFEKESKNISHSIPLDTSTTGGAFSSKLSAPKLNVSALKSNVSAPPTDTDFPDLSAKKKKTGRNKKKKEVMIL